VKRTFSMDNPGFDERPKDSTLLSIEKEKDALANIDHSHFERRKLSTLPTSEEFNDDEDDDSDAEDNNLLSRFVVSIRSFIHKEILVKRKKEIENLSYVALAGLYVAYAAIAIAYATRNRIEINWCDGHGMFIILSGLFLWGMFYYFVLKAFFGKRIQKTVFEPIGNKLKPVLGSRIGTILITLLVLGGLGVFLYFDTEGERNRLKSAGGILVIVLFGLLVSKHPGKIKWSQVLWGIGIQFIMGLVVLRWRGGQCAFECISTKVATFLDFTNAGSFFIYDYLAEGTQEIVPGFKLDGIFVFKNLSVIFFFSFFIQLLYHYGIMQWIVEKIGWILQISIGTTAAESMNAAANIFIGQTEAPILIKPFLGRMTNSELHSVMTGGFATIAGGVMAAYISMGINPSYLLSASVMAAPSALALSKLLYPETKPSRTTSKDIKFMDSIKTEGNALDAAAQGATQGVALIGNIVANIIAFMAFIAFLDAMVNWLGILVGMEYLTFQYILSKIFIPVAYIIGIDSEETEDVARLLGLKTVVNEFVAYQELQSLTKLSPRSQAIATYALCSFANVSSIGIQLGGLSVMAPERRTDLSKTIFRAFLAGSMAGLLNACLAGTLLSSVGYEEHAANGFINIVSNSSSCF